MEEKTSTHHYSAESSKRSLALVFAVSLIVLGFFGLLGAFQIIVITWEKVWPLFLLVPGLIFEISYFRNKKLSGLLVPGGILITLGLLFFFCSFTNYGILEYLWPIFIMAPGIGLLQMYFLALPAKGLFIGGIIPFSIGALFMFFTLLQHTFFSIAFPVVLIGIGLYFLYRFFVSKT
ncbi:MAG: hypothetical protein GXY29_06195 [Thermotogaceae bacterium]|nr:hypothetical protein [Thermotogaceae bacterium]HNR62842.1 hypothetical protein [Thermotogota bacterium]HOZ12320.1 hypothetical protein [Thermotogota bacterium]HPH10720.1 hypothetical protein [Thermotogota bacterium]HPM19744.1 hypothetical protein [Thermotogota bacterium]